jgi:putative N-acetylmannosamine-6-phosphate epimerase
MLETWRELPSIAQAGLAVIGGGVALDVALHGLGAAAAPEHAAHAVMLAGMVLVIGAVTAPGHVTSWHRRTTEGA